MKNIVLLLFVFIASSTFKQASAHGIHIDYSYDYPLVSLKVYYSKTAPIVNADVSVFSPGSGELHISGKTDEKGNFEFRPDVPGKWTVKVDDGMGHLKTSVIEIEDLSAQVVSGPAHTHDHDHSHDTGHEHGHSHVQTHDHDPDNPYDYSEIPLIYKIIFGLSLMFGVAGIWYGLKARKK